MIKNRFSGKIIYENKETKNFKEEVEFAVKKNIDLSGAYLSRSYLSEADLSGVNLSGADLSGADLPLAILCDCKFEKTIIFFRGKKVYVNFEEIGE